MKTLYTTYTTNNNFAKRLVMSLMVLMIVGVGSVWAETATFTWKSNPSAYTSGSSSFSEGQVTFTGTKGTGSTATRAWNDGLRMYAGGTAEFSVPDGYVITKIEGYSTFNFNNATGQQSVKFTNLSKATCSSDVTVTYKSSAEEYTITWNNSGQGTTPTSPTTASEVQLPTLTATGYTHTGWKANVAVKNGATTIAAGTLINNGTTVTLSQATTFTAQWEVNKYTVNFVASPNGYGTVSHSSIANVPYGTTVTSNNNTITINGTTVTATLADKDANYSYSFKNWSDAPSTITGTCTITANFTRTARALTNYRTSCQDDEENCRWELVTDVNNLSSQDKIVIVASEYDYALGKTENNNNRKAEAIDKSINKQTIAIDENTQEITLIGTANANEYLLHLGSSVLYAASNSYNQLLSTTNSSNENAIWSIYIDKNGIATIQATGPNKHRFMQFNTNGENPIFSCYTSTSQQSLAIYKKVECNVTPTQLTTPTELTSPNTTPNSATLSWSAIENAYSYTIKIYQSGSPVKTVQNIKSNEVTITELAPSQTYQFSVMAVGNGTIFTNSDESGKANFATTIYTVSFNPGSGTCDSSELSGDSETGITLPTATPCAYASTSGWSFVGWSESTVSETTVRPTIHTGNYKPTKDITLHAVYAKTGAGQGGAGEFILSLEYGSTTYYVGQTFDNSKLSAETDQANAARFTIEDNYLHYEGGYISHVAEGSANMTKQADKQNAKEWTIDENGNNITFTSTADDTRGLGFNYNDGSPRFAAYKLNEKDGETIKYPSTFTKTSVSGGNVQVTTYNSNPSCEAPVNPTWQPATINFEGIIQVECGSKTLLNAADPNGPATITFNGYNLQNSVTVTASNGFLVSTDKVNDAGYKSEVTINPHKEGQNIGKLQNVYVIAQAPAQSGDFTGTITLTGADITGGSQVINVTAAVTCTQYTITWSVSGDDSQKTTFYAGGEWTLPEDPTFDCNGRVFVGWTNNEIVQPQDIAPNVLYKEQGDFPTIESDITFYAVFAQEGTGDGSGTATVTDVLNREWTDVSGTTYKDWNGKTATSSAVYAGNSAGGYESIQLRSDASKDAAGIITTTSGGKATKVTVVWNNQTADGRTLNVYGKNSAYSAVADLRDENKRGTLLGTIVKGTSTSLTINDDYEYIGLCSSSGAMYLTSISIDWGTDDVGGVGSANYTSYTTSCADIKGIRIEGPTTTTFNEGDKFFFDGKVYAINNDNSETDVTASPYLRFVYDMHKTGTQTVTVNYLGKSATYEITINAVDKWKITWNVSGATNTGLGPVQVAKETAIGTPPQPKSIPAGCSGKTFVGWTESNEVNYDGSDITFITEGTVPTKNTTYYAVFATPSGDAGDGDYIKVTENLADFSGEYLIVYEDGAVAFNGGLSTLDAVSNTISVTINNSTIESNATTNAAKFTIAKENSGKYSIKSASGSYIGRTTDANELDESTSTVYTNTISITDGNADIIASGGAYLRYNNASNQYRFRYYQSSKYTNQQPIALYKKTNSSASYTDYTTGCHDVTITYYGFTGGYSTHCNGDDLNAFTQRVNSSHTIPNCGEITDPTTLGRTFMNSWKDQNGKTYAPGETFILTEDITLYAQWAMNITGNTTLPTDVDDLANTDIVVNGGNTLTLQAGTTTIKSLTLKGGIQSDGKYEMPNVWIPEGATLVRKDTKIYLDLIVNANNYYPFAVPFPTKNDANVDYLDPVLNKASTYGTHFVIKTYDGSARAINGEDREHNWVKVNRDEQLLPGVGYIITAMTYPDKDTATIRIPMTVSNDWFANGEQVSITVNETTTTRNTVAVTAHSGTASQAVNGKRHAGWNFVASPYLSKFAGNNIDNEGNLTYINGAIHINGEFAEGGENVPYVTVPAYDFSYYMSHKLSDAVLNPEWSFFVQIGTDGTMNFTTAGRQQAPAAVRANAPAENPRIEANLAILSNEVEADHTGLIIDDRYTSDYEIGADLEKMFGSAYNTTIYTIGNSTRLAYNALPHSQAQLPIPLGFRTAEDGEYTISLTNYEDITGVERIILHDLYTDIKTNLLYVDYNFYTDQTQDDNRFVVYLVPRNNTTTDLSTIIDEAQNSENRKVLINNHLYIIHNGKVYNGAGQIVK